MCDAAVSKDPYSLQYVPDWFVTQKQVKIQHGDNNYCKDNTIVEWYDGYKKPKVQEAEIKEELMSIVWHPVRMQDWYITEGGKKRITEMFAQEW